jgi:hypothetical protein
MKALAILSLLTVSTLAHAGGWQKANAPFYRSPRILSSSTDTGIGLYRKGRFLKVGPEKPSSIDGAGNGADVEISVNQRPGARIPSEKVGAVLSTYNKSLSDIAHELQKKGIGKIVKTLKDGSFVLDTGK